MKERTLRRSDKSGQGGKSCSLILFNDEVNTFDHVIKSLVEICGHDSVQAEQCAMIVHFKGSCEIRIGDREILNVMCKCLNAKGLDARVEE